MAKTVVTGALALLIGAAALFACPAGALAAEYELTPEAAVERALANHPALKAADARIVELTILLERAQANAALIPASAAMPYEDLKTKMDAKTKYLVPLQAANALAVAQRYRAALEQNIRTATLVAYYTAAKTRSMLNAAYETQFALQEQVEAARLSKREGLLMDRDVYQAQAKFAEAVHARAMLEAASSQASLTLNKLLGLLPEDYVRVTVPTYTSVSYDVSQKVNEALASRYEVFKAQKDLETAQYDLELALSYPAGTALRHIEYAQAAVNEAQAMLELQKREVEFSVRAAYAGLAAAEVKYVSRQDGYTAAAEALRVMELRREQGLATDPEVKMAEAARAQASAAVNEALCDWEIAKIRFSHLCSQGSAVAEQDGGPGQ